MESSLVSPDQLFLHIRPDPVADSFRNEQVNPAAEDVLQIEGEVHEVPKRRVLELNEYVYIAPEECAKAGTGLIKSSGSSYC